MYFREFRVLTHQTTECGYLTNPPAKLYNFQKKLLDTIQLDQAKAFVDEAMTTEIDFFYTAT